MKCGIIGLPNVGKSTFFNIISNSKVLSKNFPFCTIKPNYGIIKIPDDRLFELKKIINPIKIIPSEINIVDIAGLIKGSHKGDGLGNKFLSHIRETNAIIHMIRVFDDIKISHVEGYIDPIRDKEIIDIELQLKDLETIEKRLKKIDKKNIKIHNKNISSLLRNMISFIKEGKSIRMYPFINNNERKYIEDLQLLTIKPILYICNINNINHIENNIKIKKLQNIINKENSDILFISLKNINRQHLNLIFHSILHLLNLKTFFTAGKKEIRAWNIPKLYTAYEASSVIHTDFKKGFIKAEVINYNDFIRYKDETKLKKLGKIFSAGKNYLVQDGDIMFFKYNINKRNH
ncbi:DUF933 domain-containing protein [Blattabacterium cuenoti]|uniref:DUF933 domain-containing protein n=1 Tax=Blattabacterium cuenoti TaxID=1653831 RepID=UPI00163BDC0D|nr:DUF933 domain-containing protein [Blattabacterium cuenoti]